MLRNSPERKTLTALVQGREARRRSLKARLVALVARSAIQLVRADADTIAQHVAKLDDLLHRDVARANAFFRGTWRRSCVGQSRRRAGDSTGPRWRPTRSR